MTWGKPPTNEELADLIEGCYIDIDDLSNSIADARNKIHQYYELYNFQEYYDKAKQVFGESFKSAKMDVDSDPESMTDISFVLFVNVKEAKPTPELQSLKKTLRKELENFPLSCGITVNYDKMLQRELENYHKSLEASGNNDK